MENYTMTKKRSRITREAYIPKDAVLIDNQGTDATVYYFMDVSNRKSKRDGMPRPAMLAFHGKAQKPDLYCVYGDKTRRDEELKGFLSRRKKDAEEKAQYVGDGQMRKWYLIFKQHYSENTAKYGFGDYPEQISYVALIVEAATLRKAQNAAKKQLPELNVKFGRFAARIIPDNYEHLSVYISRPADSRLSPAAQDRHNRALGYV